MMACSTGFTKMSSYYGPGGPPITTVKTVAYLNAITVTGNSFTVRRVGDLPYALNQRRPGNQSPTIPTPASSPTPACCW